MHSESPASYADMLKTMPTDDDVDKLFQAVQRNVRQGGATAYGTLVAWEDLHISGQYWTGWD